MSSQSALRLSLVFFLAVLLTCESCRSARDEATSTPSAPQNQNSGTAAVTPPAPITWNEVASSYDRIRDYVCLYEKEERAISNGEPQNIRLTFRKSFDVRIEWLSEKGKVDQTAVYRKGLNDGKVLAKKSGMLGSLAGTLKLDPNESLARQDSLHPVTEIGIGHIIELAQQYAANPQINNRYLGEEVLDGRPAYKFEFTTTNVALGGVTNGRRGLIWVDKELKLPVKVEIYDSGQVLLERHRFKDFRINTGLNDKTFTLS